MIQAHFHLLAGHRYDWDSEGQKMADYYAKAYLTIAASRATDSRAGFLHLTDRGQYVLNTIHCESDKTQFNCIMFKSEFDEPSCEVGNPLYTRGWVFQEMLISPRVVSFGRKELEWYCRRHNWCECFDIIPSQYREKDQCSHSPHWQNTRKEVSGPDFWEWGKTVSEFTKRNLTFDSDRLPAISALATRFNETSNYKVPYLAGIWKTEPFMWKQIMWAAKARSTNSISKPGPPSWSWASLNRCISYDSWLFESPSNDSVTLLEARTQLRGTSPYGEVTGGFLRVKGVLIKIQLDITLEEPIFPDSEPEHNLTVLSTCGGLLKEAEKSIKRNLPHFPLIQFSPDTALELTPDINSSRLSTENTYQRSSRSYMNEIESMSGVVYCLRFLPKSLEPLPGPATLGAWLLVLSCTDKDTQTYERIGLVELGIVHENKQYFCEMEPQELTIV